MSKIPEAIRSAVDKMNGDDGLYGRRITVQEVAGRWIADIDGRSVVVHEMGMSEGGMLCWLMGFTAGVDLVAGKDDTP